MHTTGNTVCVQRTIITAAQVNPTNEARMEQYVGEYGQTSRALNGSAQRTWMGLRSIVRFENGDLVYDNGNDIVGWGTVRIGKEYLISDGVYVKKQGSETVSWTFHDGDTMTIKRVNTIGAGFTDISNFKKD